MIDVYPMLRPVLMAMDAERAHQCVLGALKRGLGPSYICHDKILQADVFGKSFPNPLGLAAGFDKDAEVMGACLKMGFGFVEAGTVTPRPQPGNPRPRIFRDVKSQSVINRMGFPGRGLAVFEKNLRTFRATGCSGIVGANIGMNKDAADAPDAYAEGLVRVSPFADYIAVNISSPNTPGLRGLQNRNELDALLGHLQQVRSAQKHLPPLLVKVAPDLDDDQKQDIAALVLTHNIDGLIISNTTLARPDALAPALRDEKGGLSGRLLTGLSTRTIADFYKLTGGKLLIMGVGGISSADDAYDKIRAGASLLQVYSALVFQGSAIIPRILEGLAARLRKDGFASVQDAVGTGQI